MSGREGASLRTIDRAAALLGALARGTADAPPASRRESRPAMGRGMRLADLSAETGLGKATAHRLLGALVRVGFVEFDEPEKRYRLGYGLYALGAAARRFHLVDLAAPALARLAAATGDTVYLSVRDGDEALCIDRRTGDYPIRTLTLDLGDRRPLGVGAGSLALLAFEPAAEIERILASGRAARAAYPGFDDAALAGLLAETRAQGYGFNDGRIVGAMCALGVPVFDAAGRVAAALSIAAIRERMAPERRAGLVAQLQAEAEALGRRLDAASARAQDPAA